MDGLVDHTREVFFLQKMDFSRKSIWGIGGRDIATCLEQRGSTVIIAIYNMNRDAAFILMGGNNRLVNMVTVHAFPSIFRQQRRMDVDYPVRKSLQHCFRDKP